MRRTKIICTIGPSTNSKEMLHKMAVAGMNVARLNMSHGTHESHEKVISNIKSVNETLKRPIAILVDTQGPEIRTGDLKNDFQLDEGEIITVHVCAGDIGEDIININYQDLIDTVEEGGMITVDNGLINLKVIKKNPDSMECKVIDGGTLKSKRHVNLPGIRVNLPSITEKDKEDIEFAVKQEVDYLALSFVREASDIMQLRELLGESSETIKVISKIEEQQGLKNLDEIIDVSDGVMVARGDLGIEIRIEELPNVQRMIVRKCQEKGKRVIVATHMLESMIENPIPTRAEVTDVANAVYEEADAVMLSGETSVGKYPVRCIEYLDRIAKESEKTLGLNFSENLIKSEQKQHVAATAVGIAEALDARGLVVITKRGVMAQYVTSRRPIKTFAYALTEDPRVRNQLALNRSVYGYLTEFDDNPEITVANALETLKKEEGFKSGDTVVIVSDVITVTYIDAIQIRQIP